MKANELGRLVERKTETVKMLEALLEKEGTELVELERQLGAIEVEKRKSTRPLHPPQTLQARPSSRPHGRPLLLL